MTAPHASAGAPAATDATADARRGEAGRDRWLETGLAELGRGGPAALRLEALCRRAGLTKGSFYWHFESRAAFLEALLQAWEARDTGALIDIVEAEGGPPAARLARLVELANARRVDFATEQAIRHWGRSDAAVRARLLRVDARRLDYMAGLFVALGDGAEVARGKAGLLYPLILGEGVVYRREPRAEREARRRAAFAAVLGAPLRPALPQASPVPAEDGGER
ncbi:MAG: TetR/AcrR family transcriptional regulator [Rhodobacteraceae bacterium]|jgi:AcrR family transcriptional regulator|nr:TetR/AcrR family transcriptional regulator [Paracoccaceae bacterium]